MNPHTVLARAIRLLEIELANCPTDLPHRNAGAIERTISQLVELDRSLPSRIQPLPTPTPPCRAGVPSHDEAKHLVDEYLAKGGAVNDQAARSAARFEEKYGAEGKELLDSLDLTL